MFSKRTKRKIKQRLSTGSKIVVEMAMAKDKKVELDRTHTKGRGCERLFYCIRVDPRRSEGERKTKDHWGRAKKGEVEGLGSSQSGGTRQKVLIRKRDVLMRLLARRDFMMMMMTVLDSLVNWAYKSSWVDLGGLINEGGGGNSLYPRGLKNASKQAIAVLIKKSFAFTGFKTEVNVRKGARWIGSFPKGR